MRRLLWGALAALLLSIGTAGAQSLVQGGALPVVPGRVGTWVYNGILGNGEGSAGCAATGCNKITDFGITAPGTPFCIYDNPLDSNSGYHQLCLGALATIGGETGGFLSYNAYGGAAADGLNINLNGVNYPFPGPGTGNVVGPASPVPTAGDAAIWNGGLTLKDAGAPPVIGSGTIGNVPKWTAAGTIGDGSFPYSTIAPHVATNAALAASSTAVYTGGLWRDDFAAGNGAPPLFYLPSGVACTLNSGAGDNGSQVPSSDGKCWIAQLPTHPSVLEWGAKCDASTDDTAAINAAISASLVPILPSGKTCDVATTITASANGSGLIGAGPTASIINCTGTGTQSCIVIGSAVLTSQAHGVHLENLAVQALTRTGGECIDIIGADNNPTVRDVYATSCYNGILVEYTNNVKLDHLNGHARGAWGLKWYTPTTATCGASANTQCRSDILNLDSVIWNGDFSGADCYVLDGSVNTLQVHAAIGIDCNHGLLIQNSAADGTNFPQFAFVHDMEIDGAKSHAIEIDGGRSFYFADSYFLNDYTFPGQGQADGPALYINPDTGHSYTSNISFVNTEIGVGKVQAAQVNAQNVSFANVWFRGSYTSSVSVEVTGGNDIFFANSQFCGVYGDPANNTYGLTVDVGATNVQNVTPNFKYCQTGLPNAADTNIGAGVIYSQIGGLSHNGYAMNQLPLSTVANLPGCNALTEGLHYGVTDDATAVSWGAGITGGGANHVAVYCNGSGWTVFAQ